MKKSLSLFLSFLLILSVCVAGAGLAEADLAAQLPTVDPSGAPIKVPEKIERIVVMAPSITQSIVALGEGDKIIAHDNQSVGLEGVKEGLPEFNIMAPDAEQLAALTPDIVFVSSLSAAGGENPFQPLADLGICIAVIPTSNSIEAIKSDIEFVAAVLGKAEEGRKITADMQAEIDRIAEIGKTVTQKKKVYFEIAAAPEPYSFGSGVFLNEMIEIIGAENIFADQQSWMSVEIESAVAANPDVILTNVNYIEDAVGEILNREGWGEVMAVKNKEVYYIDNLASSLPNQNIVQALNEMAKAIYPDLYA